MIGSEEPFIVLKRHNVDFVIIGGHAVNYHGFIRATEDCDLVWRRTPQMEIALLAALTEMDAKSIENDIDPATGIERTESVSAPYIRANQMMMLWTKFGFVDLFDYIPGHPTADVEDLFATSKAYEGLKYISREWLQATKRAAGRSKDLRDLEGLGLD